MKNLRLVLLLVFYVFGVIATHLFGALVPDWFGHLGRSLYTLFQVMTLESWSMGLVRPVMEVYPFAWLYFVPFILIATFMMLNLFIAVIVNAMQSTHEPSAEEQAELVRHLFLAKRGKPHPGAPPLPVLEALVPFTNT
mgnify:CR=1 FL=1